MDGRIARGRGGMNDTINLIIVVLIVGCLFFGIMIDGAVQ